MNQEDFASDSDSDDSDFLPEKIVRSDSDSPDENDDADEHEEDKNGENSKKETRKKKQGKFRKKEKSHAIEVPNLTVNSHDDDKRREEELWAAFMGESETSQPLKTPSTLTKSIVVEKNLIPMKQKVIAQAKPIPVETKIFEFAGEKVVVEENQNESQNNSSKPSSSSGVKRPSAVSGTGGLSSVLNQISKKNKLSVLQKTKLDWDGFKSTEGINEELQTHNRGKDG